MSATPAWRLQREPISRNEMWRVNARPQRGFQGRNVGHAGIGPTAKNP
jgi:hypothetical protein